MRRRSRILSMLFGLLGLVATEGRILSRFSLTERRLNQQMRRVYSCLRLFVKCSITAQVAPELLSKYLADDLPSSALDSLCEPFSQALLPLLLQKPLLNTLEALQRTLDSLDIEGLSTLWARSHTSSDTVPRLGEGEPEPTLAEWESFVGEYLSRTRNEDPESNASPPSTSVLRYHILPYLISPPS